MHIMTLFSASRLITFLRSNLAVLIVGLMVVALPVAIQAPQRANAAPITGFTRVETNGNHSCATKSDATVWCWGLNSSGQLGDGTTTNRSRPVQVLDLADVVSVDTGYDYACALKSDATVWCWGGNGNSSLGDGTTTNRSRPVQVKDSTGLSYLTGVTQVSTGSGHACAVKSNGSAWCWGWNHYGILGSGGPASNIPKEVPNISTATQIRAGGFYTCVLLASGAINCWGERLNGNYGLAGVTFLSKSKGQHICAVATDLALKCWGYNQEGQLGINNTTHQTSPTTVTGFANALSVSSSNHNSCAVKADGTPWCWGWNAFGQVGVADTANKIVPTAVSGVTGGVTQISAGYTHTCALLTDTTIKCWGDNRWGQLGDGTTTSTYNAVAVSAAPVALATPTSVVATATGSTLKSINVSWAANANAASFTVKIYNSAGASVLGTKTGVTGSSTTITSTTYGSIADNTAYKITVTAIGDGTNDLSSSESSQASVTTNALSSQTAVVLTSISGTYGTDLTLATSGGSGSGSVTYAVTTTGTAGCSITGGNALRSTSPGTCTVTATKAASGVYSADSSNATTVTFVKKTQTALEVTTTSGDAIIGITIATTGGSGTGAVTSTVTSGTATCTLTSGVVTAKTSGTCSLTVTKAADSTYLVESVTATLTFTGGAVVATTTTTAAPALSIVIQAPVTTVAQGQASVATVAPTTTTLPVLGASGLPVPTTTSTTIATAKSKTVVTTTTVAPRVTTTTVGPPSAGKVEAGQTAVQVDGVDTDAKVSRENNQMVVNAGSVSATLSGTDSSGKTLPLDTDGTVHLAAGDVIKVSVGGFEPKSIVEVWLFSTPTQLGSAVVATDGTMSGTYKLPFGIKSGSHRVVVTAKLPNGKSTTFTLGILVGKINKTSTLTRVLIAIPISLAVGFGFLLPTQARRRKRREAI
jgi:alpha-tubulin suppressor-like RCC1 family protein